MVPTKKKQKIITETYSNMKKKIYICNMIRKN